MSKDSQQDTEILAPKENTTLPGAVLILLGAFFMIASFSMSYSCGAPSGGGGCVPPSGFYVEAYGLLVSGVGCISAGIYLIVRKKRK
ncbi:MAG: hypothetical protein PXY39_11535 [archaeon]|nr:hypothetical protein [archaeon]